MIKNEMVTVKGKERGEKDKKIKKSRRLELGSSIFSLPGPNFFVIVVTDGFFSLGSERSIFYFLFVVL